LLPVAADSVNFVVIGDNGTGDTPEFDGDDELTIDQPDGTGTLSRRWVNATKNRRASISLLPRK
jgi:hypothetical protein